MVYLQLNIRPDSGLVPEFVFLAWADEDFSRMERVDADMLCNDFQVSPDCHLFLICYMIRKLIIQITPDRLFPIPFQFLRKALLIYGEHTEERREM